DPVVDFIERRGASRPRAIMSVFALALVILTALLSSVVPQVITETRQLADRIPEYADWVERRAEKWISNPPAWVRKVLQHQPTTQAAPALPAITNETALANATNVVVPTTPNATATN